jgi:hypothetical protein
MALGKHATIYITVPLQHVHSTRSRALASGPSNRGRSVQLLESAAVDHLQWGEAVTRHKLPTGTTDGWSDVQERMQACRVEDSRLQQSPTSEPEHTRIQFHHSYPCTAGNAVHVHGCSTLPCHTYRQHAGI